MPSFSLLIAFFFTFVEKLRMKINKKIIFLAGILLVVGSLTGGFWIYQHRLDKNQKEYHPEIEIESNKANKEAAPKREPEKSVVVEEKNVSQSADESTEPVVALIENESNDIESVKEIVESKNLSPVYLAQSKSLFNPANTSIENLPAGKAYFQGENGKLESIVNKKEDGISEQLVSYDYHGQKADDLEIGWIDDAGQTVKYAVILGNKISIFETIKTKKKTETKVTEYAITPQLKFIKGKAYTRLM
jgi:hypothetical protein